jgi:hypothetical protein
MTEETEKPNQLLEEHRKLIDSSQTMLDELGLKRIKLVSLKHGRRKENQTLRSLQNKASR